MKAACTGDSMQERLKRRKISVKIWGDRDRDQNNPRKDGADPMLLIWSHDHQFEFLGMVDRPCPGCGRSPSGLYRATRKFALYGVSLFQTGAKFALGCH